MRAYANFTVWLPILIVALLFPLVGCPAVLLIFGALWLWRRRAGRDVVLSTQTIGDRVAWVSFNVGVLVMFGVVLASLLSESDGDFRTWAQIRRHTRIFLAAGFMAALVPTFIAIGQLLTRRGTKKLPLLGNDPAANRDYR